MKSSTINCCISLLICALLAFTTAQAPQERSVSNTIQFELFEGSNEHWIAIAVQNADVDTIAVQIRDASEGAEYVSMQYIPDWGYWVINSPDEFVFPLSFLVTSKAEQDIEVLDIVPSLDADVVDTGVQYSHPVAMEKRASSHGSHRRPNRPNRPNRPTATTTRPPTSTTTVKPATTTKATSTPTTTVKPTTTTKATSAPTTTKATTAPAAGSNSGKMKLMVPLYTYPGASWSTVAASASKVATVAIINPNSGPGNGPDSAYNTYMDTLHKAGVEMIGYVHTSYGARSIADVKADINKYASEFPLVTGIFIDEAAATADQVSYYTQVHQHIMSMPGYKYNVLNPGTVPTQAYYSISTQIVTFEDIHSKFASSSNPSWANASNKDHFALITYGASSSQMESVLTAAKSKGYYGWVYVTDGPQGGTTYNALTSYYAAQATKIASL